MYKGIRMAFFRLKSVPGCQWPALADSDLSQVWAAYRELDCTQWLDPDLIQQGQLAQVRTLLTHCLAHVPYYRQVLSAARIDPRAIQSLADFRRVPLLPRRTYQEKATAFVAQQLPGGTVATAIAQTSGSSGTPTQVFQTNMVHLWWFAFYLRDLQWSNLDPLGSLATIRSLGSRAERNPEFLRGITVPYWMAELQSLIETGPSHFLDIRQDPRRQLHWLRQLSPHYLLSYPANLEALANLVREEGPLPGLRAVRAVSDTLSEEKRAAIETGFGVSISNNYSCAEVGYLATTCPTGQGLHVHAENVLLEVLDEAGQPCQPGQTGRVYLTGLHNFRGPLVRYEVGDEATLGPRRCACGRGLPVLVRVQGKNSPLFHLPNGGLKSSAGVSHLVGRLGGHWQHQVVQKALDHVVVRLAVTPTWSEQHAQELREKIQAFFEAPIRVDLEIREHLPVPPSGKFQSMIVEVP
jgi:phenylacetate-CoA ligase